MVIEPTSGNNTGLGSIARAKGYRMILTMPETRAERRNILKAYGPRLCWTPGEKGTTGAMERAKELAEGKSGQFIPDSLTTRENPKAHEKTTGLKFWDDTTAVDVFVAGVGTGGTPRNRPLLKGHEPRH